MPIINIRPLSVNCAWQGRKFKTRDYKEYEEEVYYSLPALKIPEGKLEINYIFGFSNTQSDWDNPIKPFTDILQKKYNFNDNRIYYATVKKEKVKKGEEFIEFKISEWKD